MSLVDSISKILNENTFQFKASARLEVHVEEEGVLHDSPAKIIVPFDIDLEFRSWGIKGIDVLVGGKQSVELLFSRGEETFLKEIEIDLDKSKVETGEHFENGVTITSVFLSLDKDYKQKDIVVRVSE